LAVVVLLVELMDLQEVEVVEVQAEMVEIPVMVVDNIQVEQHFLVLVKRVPLYKVVMQLDKMQVEVVVDTMVEVLV